MKNVQVAFDTLRESRVEYAVIKDWVNMPNMIPDTITILTAKPKLLVQAIGLKKVEYDDSDTLFELELDDGRRQKFEILETNQGHYPASFEQNLLSQAVMHNNSSIKVPAYNEAFWQLIYDAVHRQTPCRFSKLEMKIVAPMLEMRVGPPVRPKAQKKKKSRA